MRIVQISDTHLLADGGAPSENLELLVDYINGTLRPDLVFHTGDIIGVWPDDQDDREAALRALRLLDAPLLAVPGNHDVGGPEPSPWMGITVTSARVAEHERAFGEVPFIEAFGEWRIVGLNSELLGSGLPEEEEQWEWLENALGTASGGPVLLFLHRPVWPLYPGAPIEDRIPDAARERLLALPGARRLCAVGNGHLHCYRRRQRPELLEVWAPASAFVGDPTFAEMTQCGVVEWVLDGDQADARFLAPVGLQERQFADVPQFAARVEALRR